MAEQGNQTATAVTRTDFPALKLRSRGKVRDIYEVDGRILLVATDRISAFDVVLPNGIPNKGKVLTGLSRFWFEYMERIVPNHVIATDVERYPRAAAAYLDTLRDRSMLVKKAEPYPVECVVRGYLAGSAVKEYRQNQSVCGIKLPAGLRESEKLPEPIFTPATKAETGHDINITRKEMANRIGEEKTKLLIEKSLAIFNAASAYALSRGLILSDTKFEFGEYDGQTILIDELLTPDSSRYWLAGTYEVGKPQTNFDKQYVRDYLETLDWDKTPPGPALPPDVVARTEEKYKQAYKLITGKDLQ
ncbi:MAG: phosphoribosylaminoimidazolesuccinocarboxamide synthase [Candidatus Abyssobacteria bacterium SURF_17]|jgi:phosphoribosylaminoimidazole-succinocarboxamide synthase|uniref:Phosphoribosylaminoimidazole-succinocarboxamide synthase n=1 Tax=Candidatus Abyssobacteria bacterium SURF_17 TaxID=2093361 RepID=A0A419F2S7_9BACT|nr:MAG: phosphoribosylaminoimidazolesuccinocarboxamide synthase [Candidatus Abyssubacteria bacterium SURF_17]